MESICRDGIFGTFVVTIYNWNLALSRTANQLPTMDHVAHFLRIEIDPKKNLRAGDHDVFPKSQVKNSFTMVNQCVDNFASVKIPHSK